VVNGEVVDEFSGALPESQVRVFLDRLQPSPAEKLRQQAGRQRKDGAAERARELLQEAQALEPENERVRIDLIRTLLDLDETAAAREQLEGLSLTTRLEDAVKELESRLEFAEQSRNLPPEVELLERIEGKPDDLDARLQLANRYTNEQRYAEAMQQLLEIIRRDRGFEDDIGRTRLLALFNIVDDPELVREYRRRLAAVLH